MTERDEIVFHEVRNRGIPIIMVTSGGYQVGMFLLSGPGLMECSGGFRELGEATHLSALSQ